jgi:hypothetical protein
MTANASIITSEKTNVLRLPGSAFRFAPTTLGMTVLPATNTVSTNDIVRPRRGGGMGGMEGLPTPPWMAGGARRRPTDEEKEKYTASLTPEQKEQYDKFQAEMRRRMAEAGAGGGGGGGQGGPGGGGGGNGPGGASNRSSTAFEGPTLRTVYKVVPTGDQAAPNAKPTVQAVNVKVGITDGNGYEVLEGLQESDLVITGTKGGTQASAAAPSSPFGSPFGGGPRR